MKVSFLPYMFLLMATTGIYCSKGGRAGGSANQCNGISTSVLGYVVHPSSTTAFDGSISATATAGAGFQFNINGGPFQSSGTFDNLGPGTYTIIARNNAGCTGMGVYVLAAPQCTGITINVTGTVMHPTLPPGHNGSITVNATGSTGFTYNINGGPFQTGATFINLGEGSYTVVAKDANGCTGTASFFLVLTTPICSSVIIIPIATNIVDNTPCSSIPTGQFTLIGAGGTPPYTYSYRGGPFLSNNTFTNLLAGFHNVTVKDANGCTGGTSTTIYDLLAGTLFSQVKSLLQTNCVSCHNAVLAEGGMDWTQDCNIVFFKDRIKARAVDGIPSPMPLTGLLPVAERQKITNWINAGGKFTN